MSEAPERIWIEDEFGEGDDDQWTYGTWDVRNYAGYDVEYARADTVPHVNETPKSEHDTANMLTLIAERDRLAAAVDAVMADRKRILEERDRGFVMVMERAERAEAEVARLTALLPHPGETAQEVMWRNHQRGVRLEELAKAAGVTRERARQMVRKAEARLAKADNARLREAALREALAAVNAKWRSGADTPDEMRGLALAEAAIFDLIDGEGP
jgi:hypothetical protein